MNKCKRIWFPYPVALLIAGHKAMEIHSPIEERQYKANGYYEGCQRGFLDSLEVMGINTDAKAVENELNKE